MAGGGGDVDSLLLGSERAADKDGPHFYVKTLKVHLKHYIHTVYMNTHEHMHVLKERSQNEEAVP